MSLKCDTWKPLGSFDCKARVKQRLQRFGRVEDWRADCRFRWVIHSFRGGPQSGYHHHGVFSIFATKVTR